MHNTIILISHSEQVVLKTQNFFENLLTFLFHTQDQELKRKYLALLPPQQIIEICLTFDPHVPLYVKSTVWPSDINAAIAALQQNPPPSSEPAQPAPAPPMQPLQPPPQQPYGFSSSSAYPHNPYYPAHSTAYAYPHPAYTPYPPIQNGYPHPHVRPAYPSPSGYNNLTPLPPPPEGVSTDDLPSYEEMIVEALSSTTDPEGYAPKDLFTWMASRYPLQSNFRPSASQALQKAYKRGRFEKSSGGKYRLNPTWDGGNVRYIDSLLCSIDLCLQVTFTYFIQTLRRSTRRPQTQSSISSGPPVPASPFTKTPLVHHHQQTPAPFNAAAPPLPPYGYPYVHTAGPLPVAGPSVPTPPAPPTNVEPAVDSRTELQVQLALLAVQLAELSEAEEAVSIVQAVEHVPPSPPVPTTLPTNDPPPQIPSATSVPDLNPSETENDDDHSDDDDMEEII